MTQTTHSHSLAVEAAGKTVTESIYSGKSITIPLALVQHIERRQHGQYMVVMKSSTYNAEFDDYNNAPCLDKEEGPKFMAAWCRYRAEIEASTLMDMSPSDAELTSQQEVAAPVSPGILEALQFYANKFHFTIHDDSLWDTVSGEPPNFWEDEANSATVEDGSIARLALAASREWMPVTPELIEKLSQEDRNPYWLCARNGTIYQGQYEWRQGCSPDRFVGEIGDVHALGGDVTHIMPFKKPAGPATHKAQESGK